MLYVYIIYKILNTNYNNDKFQIEFYGSYFKSSNISHSHTV